MEAASHSPWHTRKDKAMVYYRQCANTLPCWLALVKLRWVPDAVADDVNAWLTAAGRWLGLTAADTPGDAVLLV